MAVDGNVLLHPDALHCLKRKQLVNLCRRFGIKAIGKNSELIEKLQQYAASNIPPDSPTKGNVMLLRHVKRSRSESSLETSEDESPRRPALQLPYPPLTPRTRQARVSDLVKAIEEVKADVDDMDEDEEEMDVTMVKPSSRQDHQTGSASTDGSPKKQQGERKEMSPGPTQPLRIIKALPNTSRISLSMSTASMLELSRSEDLKPSDPTARAPPRLYPDLTLLPLPEGVSSDNIVSSSTLPSISSRQFSAAAASVLAEMNARLSAAGKSSTQSSLTSLGDNKWASSYSSLRDLGMNKSPSGRYEIHHERQFKKMDSIVNHYAARRIAPRANLSSSTSKPRLATSQRSNRVDASTSTRSLAVMSRSDSRHGDGTTSKLGAAGRGLRGPDSAAPTAMEQPKTKKLRLAVSEDHDALQNTVIEIPKEKNVVIKITRPEREGPPYKFSVTASNSTKNIVPSASIRKTVIKASRNPFSSKKTRSESTKALNQKRDAVSAAAAKQQTMTRSISQRNTVVASTSTSADSKRPQPVNGSVPASTSIKNKFTGVVTTKRDAACSADTSQESRGRIFRDVPTVSTPSFGGAARKASAQSNTTAKSNATSSTMASSLRSSVSAGLQRAEALRQARLKEVKARTRAAWAGLDPRRPLPTPPHTSASPAAVLAGITGHATISKALPTTPGKPVQPFSPSVTRPTVASLGRARGQEQLQQHNREESQQEQRTPSNSGPPPSMPAMAMCSSSMMMLKNKPLQRAATVNGPLTPLVTPRSSSLRHLRRVMRKQEKEAQMEHDRVAAAENIEPYAVVPSVCALTSSMHPNTESKIRPTSAPIYFDDPTIRTVFGAASSPIKDSYTTMPVQSRTAPGGPRSPLVRSLRAGNHA